MAVGNLRKIAGLRTLTELQDIEQSVINPLGDIDDQIMSGQGPASGIGESGIDPAEDIVSSSGAVEESEFSSLTSGDEDNGDSIFAVEPDSGESYDFAGISLSDNYDESSSWQSARVSVGDSGAGFELPFVDYVEPDAGIAGISAYDTGNLPGGDFAGGDAAPGAPATLQMLADYLTTGYWGLGEAGGGVRHYNLTGAGTGANSGIIYYNVAGFTGISGAGTDLKGLTSARRAMVRDALDIYEDVLGINFVETTSQANHVDLFFKDNDSNAYSGSIKHSGTDFIDYS